MSGKIPVVCVVGPTASGKSDLAVELALRLDGEVVSADSMQIYRGMDIATAKIRPDEMRGVPHHLLDFLQPGTPYSVADYVRDAERVIREICGRGRLPFVVGGTGLYVSSLIDHVQYAEIGSSETLREQLRERAAREGTAALLRELAEFDPQSAEKLHENDQKRIIRAIEIYRLSGKTKTEWEAVSRREESPYDPYFLGLTAPREMLYDRIDRRVERMMQEGLLQEVCRISQSVPQPATAQQAIGYKELLPYLRGECTLEEAVAAIQQETRRYAKRQLSWFRRDERIRWVDRREPIDADLLANRIRDYYQIKSEKD